MEDVYKTGSGEYLGGEPLHISISGDPEEALMIYELIGANRYKAEIVVV